MLKIFNKETLTNIGIHTGIVLFILLATIIMVKIVRKLLAKKDKVLSIDSTQYKFLSHLFSGIIYFFGTMLALYSIPYLRGLGTTLFAGSSIMVVAIGFAAQQAFSNIIAGVFIAIFKPFRLEDRIKFINKDVLGQVEDITLRHTVIRTYDNKRIIVPNSVISSEIFENANLVDDRTQKFFDIGISYDSNIDLAISIIKEEAMNHKNFLDNRDEEQIANNDPPVKVRVLGFGDSSINLRGYIWAETPSKAFVMGCDLNKSVKERFDKEGVEIPFPYRTIVYKDKNSNSLNK